MIVNTSEQNAVKGKAINSNWNAVKGKAMIVNTSNQNSFKGKAINSNQNAVKGKPRLLIPSTRTLSRGKPRLLIPPARTLSMGKLSTPTGLLTRVHKQQGHEQPNHQQTSLELLMIWTRVTPSRGRNWPARPAKSERCSTELR